MSNNRFYTLFFLAFLSLSNACMPLVASDDDDDNNNNVAGSTRIDNIITAFNAKQSSYTASRTRISNALIDKVQTINIQNQYQQSISTTVAMKFSVIVKTDAILQTISRTPQGNIMVHKNSEEGINADILSQEEEDIKNDKLKKSLDYILDNTSIDDGTKVKSRVLMTKAEQTSVIASLTNKLADIKGDISNNDKFNDDAKQALDYIKDKVSNDDLDIFLSKLAFFDDQSTSLEQWMDNILVNKGTDDSLKAREAFGNMEENLYNELKGHLDKIIAVWTTNKGGDDDQGKKEAIRLLDSFVDTLKRLHETKAEMVPLSQEASRVLVDNLEAIKVDELAQVKEGINHSDDILESRTSKEKQQQIAEDVYHDQLNNLNLTLWQLMELLYGTILLDSRGNIKYQLLPDKPRLFALQLRTLERLLNSALANKGQYERSYADIIAPFIMPPFFSARLGKKLGVKNKNIIMHKMINHWKDQLHYMKEYAKSSRTYTEFKKAKIQADVDMLQGINDQGHIVMTDLLDKIGEDKALKSLAPKPYNTPHTLTSIKRQRGAKVVSYLVWIGVTYLVVKRVYVYLQSSDKKDYKKDDNIDDDDDDEE